MTGKNTNKKKINTIYIKKKTTPNNNYQDNFLKYI